MQSSGRALQSEGTVSAKALGLSRRRRMVGNKARKAGSSQTMQGPAGHSEDTGFHSEDHGHQKRIVNGGLPATHLFCKMTDRTLQKSHPTVA